MKASCLLACEKSHDAVYHIAPRRYKSFGFDANKPIERAKRERREKNERK